MILPIGARGMITPGLGFIHPYGGPFGGHATLGTNCVGAWKFDEISGTTAEDTHGSNDGTASNARIFTTEATGMRNTCADFTQGNDVITIPHNSSISGDTMSYSFWVKGNGSISSLQVLLFKAPDTGFNREISIEFSATGTLLVQAYRTSPNTSGNVQTDSAVWSTSWKHYLIVKDLNGGNTRITIYQNATQIKQGTLAYKANTNTNGYVVGAAQTKTTYPTYNYFLNAYLDEMYFFKEALTSDHASDLYASGSGLFY